MILVSDGGRSARRSPINGAGAMPQVTATFEAVTPLFLGGADPASSAELRAASVKGALRFWWRALAWSRLRGDLAAIRAKESCLFGSASEADALQKTGQASFLLRVVRTSEAKLIPGGELLLGQRGSPVGPGMRYLGYGLMEAFGRNAGRLTRPCFAPPMQLSLQFLSRRPLDRSVVEAIKLLGLLGGLGSRVRRGYGSVSIASLSGDADQWSAPTTATEYADQLRAIIQGYPLWPTEPPYSAFSDVGRIVIVDRSNEPLSLLDKVGKQMQRYRSWGHNGQVNGEASERNFRDDHDWFKTGAGPNTKPPRRVVFGLPHNYSKVAGVVSEQHGRRASPLAVHIHKLGSVYIAVFAVLRSNFLAEGDRLLMRNGSVQTAYAPQIDWTALDRFILGNSKQTGRPYFPDRVQILP